MDKVRYLPLALFGIFFAKILFQSPSYTDCAILFILGLTAAFFEFEATDKKIKEKEVKFDEATKLLLEKSKELDSIKASVNSLKLSIGGRSVNAVR